MVKNSAKKSVISCAQVLLVDDSTVWTKFLSRAFREQGFQVQAVHDGLQAFERINLCYPDIVVADYFLPKIDGGRLAQYIKQNPKTRGTKVIILSGAVGSVSQIEFQAADAVIAKNKLPITANHVFEAIRNLKTPALAQHYRDRVIGTEGLIKRSITAKIHNIKHHMNRLYEAIGNMVFEADNQGKIVNLNTQAAVLLQQPVPMLIGKRLKLVLNADGHALGNAIERILTENGTTRLNLDRRHGSRLFRCSLSRLQRINARHHILLIMEDITQEQQAQEALRNSEARLRWVFENTPVGLLWIEKDRVTLINSYACRLFGLDSHAACTGAELNGQAAGILQQLRRHWTAGDTHRGGKTFWIQRVDGEKRFVNMRLALQANGTHDNRLAVLTDLTEQRANEAEREKLRRQLMRSQKLDAVGRLAGGIAHDFNNILTAIMNHLCLAMLDLEESHPLYRRLKEINRSADKASELTRQLLTLGRKQVAVTKILDMNHLVNKWHTMLRHLLREDIAFSYNLAGDLWPVKADPAQMEQAIINLVINARDAMKTGGSLALYTANVRLPGTPQSDFPDPHGQYVRISVTDSGCGMDDKVKSRIFEPFFSTKPAEQGSGLGLSIVYGIVQMHQGLIKVDSLPGAGTTIHILLPRADAGDAHLQEPEQAETMPAGDETLLYVEDNDSVRQTTREAITRLGYQVICAGAGQQAIGICRSLNRHIHLLLTDIVMPGMSGHELAKHIQSIRPEVRVLFTSGYAEHMVQAIERGVKGIHYLPKPYTISALAQKIRAILDA